MTLHVGQMFGDVGPVAAALDDAERDRALHRLAHRRAGDLELLGQPALRRHLGARLQLAAGDALDEAVADQRAERLAGDGSNDGRPALGGCRGGVGHHRGESADRTSGSTVSPLSDVSGRSACWSDHPTDGSTLGSGRMGYPNTLIFVDFPSTDPAASAEFYAAVFGWEVEPRPEGRVPPHRAGRAVPARRRHAGPDGQPAHGHLQRRQRPAAPRARPASSRATSPPTGARCGRGSSSATTTPMDRILDEAGDAGRRDPVARPLLGRVQRLQRRVQGPVGQHAGAVGQGRRRPADPGGTSPVSDGAGPRPCRPAGSRAGRTSRCGSRDIDASIAWYNEFTPLELLDRHQDDLGFGAWLGQPDSPDKPVHPRAGPVPARRPTRSTATRRRCWRRSPTSASSCRARDDIDDIAARGEAAGCLAMPPQQMPAPIGYVCMLARSRRQHGRVLLRPGRVRQGAGGVGAARCVGVTAAPAAVVALAYLASFASR